MRPAKKKTQQPLTYREFREEFEGNNKVAPRELGVFPNRDREYEEKAELSEGWKDRNKVFIGPDRKYHDEPLEHFPGLYPTATLSLRAVKRALEDAVYFKMKKREPNRDNVDVYDTDSKKEKKHGPRERKMELFYDSTPSVEKGVETEYERPMPWLSDPMSGIQRTLAPYI